MSVPKKRLTVAALTSSIFIPTLASADVVRLDLLTAALASSSKIHSCKEKPPFGNAPCISIGNGLYQGFLMPSAMDYGFLGDGQDVLIVPLGSGGSGGVFVDLLFTSIKTKPYFIGVIPSESGHLKVYISGGQIVVNTPVYKSGEPSCCPSTRHFTRHELMRNSLKKIEEFDEYLAT